MSTPQLRAHGSAPRIVGSGGDPESIAMALQQGSSVVVAGMFGIGKTHLLQSVARALEPAGVSPLRLHPGRYSARRPFAALDAVPDPRAAELRGGVLGGRGQPVIALVDDAHLLDADSAAAIAEAVHAGSLAALLCIEVSRAGRTEGVAEATSIIIDLSLRGAADRVDLTEMTQGEAYALLELLPGTERLDAVTRSGIVSLADGSRRLLRELAAEALVAVEAGRDPLTALQEEPRRASLSHSVGAHLAHLRPGERRALAFLGMLPRLAYADAIRFLDPRVVDHLIGIGLVHQDGSVHRRLIANPCLAREPVHDLDPAERSRMLRDAAARMLTADGAWWSVPIAVMIAQEWHGGREGVPSPASIPPAMRARVMRDAARRANDTGAPALAIAFASATDAADPATALERTYAEALLGSAAARDSLAETDPAALEEGLLRRYLRMRAPTVAPPALGFVLPPAAAPSERTAAELSIAAAEAAALDLQWDAALAAVEPLPGHADVEATTALRAALVGAMSAAHLGRWAQARGFLDRARTLTDPTEPVAAVPVHERLLALAVELVACGIAGAPATTLPARLRHETVSAVREGEPAAIVFAGFCNALVYAGAGDARLAAQEVSAAADRSASLPFGSVVPLLQLMIANCVALSGNPSEARTMIRGAASATGSPGAVAHRRAVAELTVLAAEGETTVALGLAREALAMSSTSPALRLRDLFRVAALGGVDDGVLSAVRETASSVDLPAAPIVLSHVERLAKGRREAARRSPFDLLRIGAPWLEGGLGLVPADVSAAGQGGTLVALDLVRRLPSGRRLTARELEIAHLVADGLSNREIAGRLYLSVRTVESHAYQARIKLGARSRAEFGRALARLVAPEPPTEP